MKGLLEFLVRIGSLHRGHLAFLYIENLVVPVRAFDDAKIDGRLRRDGTIGNSTERERLEIVSINALDPHVDEVARLLHEAKAS